LNYEVEVDHEIGVRGASKAHSELELVSSLVGLKLSLSNELVRCERGHFLNRDKRLSSVIGSVDNCIGLGSANSLVTDSSSSTVIRFTKLSFDDLTSLLSQSTVRCTTCNCSNREWSQSSGETRINDRDLEANVWLEALRYVGHGVG